MSRFVRIDYRNTMRNNPMIKQSYEHLMKRFSCKDELNKFLETIGFKEDHTRIDFGSYTEIALVDYLPMHLDSWKCPIEPELIRYVKYIDNETGREQSKYQYNLDTLCKRLAILFFYYHDYFEQFIEPCDYF